MKTLAFVALFLSFSCLSVAPAAPPVDRPDGSGPVDDAGAGELGRGPGDRVAGDLLYAAESRSEIAALDAGADGPSAELPPAAEAGADARAPDGLAVASCDLATHAGCPSGLSCRLDRTVSSCLVCTTVSGPKGFGDRCTSYAECQAGMACVWYQGPGVYACAPYCRGTVGCPSGSSCVGSIGPHDGKCDNDYSFCIR